MNPIRFLRKLLRRQRYGALVCKAMELAESESVEDGDILFSVRYHGPANKTMTLASSGALDLEVGNGPA